MLTLRIWLLAFDSSYPTYELGLFLETNADLGDPNILFFQKDPGRRVFRG